jgi:hypothetical protein
MINQTYELQELGTTLQFWVADSSGCGENHREFAITVFNRKEKKQYDFSLNIEETESLINFLKNSKEYIENFYNV